MQPSTIALIRTALANDNTVDAEHFAIVVQILEQPVPAFLPRVKNRPLLTMKRLAHEVGVSRWTIERELKKHGVENLPPDCKPSTPRRRKMYPPTLAEWFRQRR